MKASHMILGWHTETGQPTRLALGLGRTDSAAPEGSLRIIPVGSHPRQSLHRLILSLVDGFPARLLAASDVSFTR
jgi:hypothetical protein